MAKKRRHELRKHNDLIIKKFTQRVSITKEF